ncbi:MAG: HlyD family efflux transporter periplasmic adaptor subunit [Methylomonas sp.]|jgi:HlyD family secretion protein|uniref:HlyD family efflux transporter periplasmic adaptor subunit n=1 Tax=Methylomonas sp. TaxID=418 RepID=UPI0025D2F440|nr:HlyD family efflux transporter periplasmic adaptor subunit [Methylomonas sp.]MCK9609329.1 HlyD family efflux transporter periplasmic adaptor subunit [Methylomonas sp.]
MTKHHKATIVLLVVAGCLIAGFYLRRDDPPTTQLTLYGNIDIRQVELSFREPERIEQILVQEGEQVKAGQVLASQILNGYQYQVDLAAARLEAQQHQLEKLLHGSRPQEIGIARNDVKAAEASVTLAEKELQRLKTLAIRKLASSQSVDKAKAAYDSAKENLQALKEQYALAKIGPRAEDIKAAQAQLKADQASLELARKSWRDAHLLAPRDAVIQNRILEPGDMANAQTPVLTLALHDPLWARTYVEERDLGKLRHGMPALVSSDSFPTKQYKGWIGYISPTAEFTPKSVETTELRTSLVYQLRVYVCNPQDQLRLGMPVTVSVDTTQAPSSIPDCQSEAP